MIPGFDPLTFQTLRIRRGQCLELELITPPLAFGLDFLGKDKNYN